MQDHSRFWIPFSPTELEKHIKEGRVVLVFFYADWSLESNLLKTDVLETRKMHHFIASNGVVAMMADYSRDDATVKRALRQLSSVHYVPIIAIFSALNPENPIMLMGPSVTQDDVISNLKDQLSQQMTTENVRQQRTKRQSSASPNRLDRKSTIHNLVI